eukprot:5734193-Pleurochrysis_carterae.AAC.2
MLAPIRSEPMAAVFLEESLPQDLCEGPPPYGILYHTWALDRDKLDNMLHHALSEHERCMLAAISLNHQLKARLETKRHEALSIRLKLQWERCAVVGSSSSLLGSGLGRQIDSNQLIIRINRAPPSPALDVGSRTDLIISHGMNEWTQWHAKLGQRFKPRFGYGVYCLGHWGACFRYVQQANDSTIAQIAPSLIAHVQFALNRIGQAPDRHPSTGLVAVAIAQHRCRRTEVFGFDLSPPIKQQKRCSHYYDCKVNTSDYFDVNFEGGVHNWTAQRQLLTTWALDGRIVPFFSH